MQYPKLFTNFLLDRLKILEGKINIVIDTDTYNEIDDQFALAYALKSDDRLIIEAIYAAPFSNKIIDNPSEGMLKSYEEIQRVLNVLNLKKEVLVFKGSTHYLTDIETPCMSEAVEDIVKRAMNAKEPLYAVALGAITNIASAILLEPKIIEKIVIIWMGGNSLYWNDAKDFNLMQDVIGARILFDSGVPIIHIPALNVTSHLLASVFEIEYYLNNKNPIGTYLTKIFRDHQFQNSRLSKELWDIAAIAFLLNSSWVPTNIVHSPILTDQLTWSIDSSRHFMKTAISVDRDAIFQDMYKRITDK